MSGRLILLMALIMSFFYEIIDLFTKVDICGSTFPFLSLLSVYLRDKQRDQPETSAAASMIEEQIDTRTVE